MNRSIRPARRIATGALAATTLFPAIVIALNLANRSSYSPTRQAISELALGPGGVFMAVAFCGLGIGIFLVAVTIYRTTVNSRVAPFLLAVASVGAGPLSAAFPTDRTGAKATLHGNIHNGAGLAAFLLILVAMIVCAYRFRREPCWRGHTKPTTALAALGIITFFLIPMLGNSDFGLAERLFVGTFVIWLLATAHYARGDQTAEDAARTAASEGIPAGSSTSSA